MKMLQLPKTGQIPVRSLILTVLAIAAFITVVWPNPYLILALLAVIAIGQLYEQQINQKILKQTYQVHYETIKVSYLAEIDRTNAAHAEAIDQLNQQFNQERQQYTQEITRLQAELNHSQTAHQEVLQQLESLYSCEQELQVKLEMLEAGNREETDKLELEKLKSEQENEKLKDRCTQLIETNRKLEQAVSRLKSDLNVVAFGSGSNIKSEEVVPIIFKTTEKDLYDCEVRDIILHILENSSKKGVRQDSRRAHILSDLLKRNSPHGERQRLEKNLDSLLSKCEQVDAKTKRSLEKLGFQISETGKHYKIVFQGDDRYTFSLSKSSSDYRSSNNLSSDIRGLLL